MGPKKKQFLLDLTFASQASRDHLHVRVASALVNVLLALVLDCFLGTWTNVIAILVTHWIRAPISYSTNWGMACSGALLGLYMNVPGWKSYLLYDGLFIYTFNLMYTGLHVIFDESRPLETRRTEFALRRDVFGIYFACVIPWKWSQGFRYFLQSILKYAIAPCVVALCGLALWAPTRKGLPILTRWQRMSLSAGLAIIGDLRIIGAALFLHYLPKLLRNASLRLETTFWPMPQRPYQYVALPHDHIRFLVLRPPRWPFWSTIEADLISAPRDMLPKYQAISYHWGDPTRTRSVVINDARLPITQSAADALSSCRSLSRGRDSVVWIDAICINQADTAEKTAQVRLMRAIYTHASAVTLFPSDDWRWRLASRLMQEIGSELLSESVASADNQFALEDWVKRGRKNTPSSGLDQFPTGDFSTDVSLGLSPRWAALTRLVQDDYWSRVWIIQEICVGRDVSLHLAGSLVSWKSYAKTVTLAMHPDNRHLLSLMHFREGNQMSWNTGAIDPFMAFTVHTALKDMPLASTPNLFRGIKDDYAKRMRLDALLFDTLKMGASDQKDKVFALMGIASDSGSGELPKIEYSKTSEDVFEEAASYLLIHQNELSHCFLGLAGAGYSKHRRRIPSWVPRLDEVRACLPLTRPCYIGSVYKAGGPPGTAASISKGILPSSIMLTGVLLDSIYCFTTDQPLKYDVDKNGEVDVLEVARKKYTFALETITINVAFEESPTVLDAVLSGLGDALSGGQISYYEPRSLYEDVFERWLQAMQWTFQAEDLSQYANNVADRLKSTGDTAIGDGSIGVYDAHVVATIYGRRFGMSDGGRLCSVPPFAKEGDEIFVPHGAQTPFVVRRDRTGEDDQEAFELIGEAYVQGLMRGEALTNKAARNATIMVV